MASPSSNLSSLTTMDPDDESSKTHIASTLPARKEHTAQGDVENCTFRSLSSPFNNHQTTTTSDATVSPPNADVPQWKKDLIQRRKTNIAKTIAANQGIFNAGNFSKEGNLPNTESLGALSPTSDFKNPLIFTNNNNSDKPSTRSNTSNDTKSNTSQNSLAPADSINNMLKTPATIQPQDEIESSCGGHYTQVNNKSTGGSSIHNYSEKIAAAAATTPPTAAARPASVVQPEQPPPVPLTRSFGIIEKNSNNDGGNPTLASAAQENVRFRKNLTEQRGSTNTISSDSLITSTSRLSSSLKVAAAAEIYKKSNKDNSSIVCVGEQQRSHIFQEPALAIATNVSNNTNNNGNGGGGDDEQQLHHHQLNTGHESDSLVCASLNEVDAKEIDSKIYSINKSNTINKTNGGNNTLLLKAVNNKKPCGVAGASVRSSPTSGSSSQFIKNQNISNATLVSTHHNYKINTKARINQNQNQNSSVSPSVSVSATTSIANVSPTTVTNNKKKMVAVQEMNEITNNELDFDPSEELQYGPGIVSKLRCRYLSLALRQSTAKQRLSMDSLRRATSLNNLLDDNGVHDDDEEEDDDTTETTNKAATSPTSMAIPQIGTKETSIKVNETAVGFKKNAKADSGERITGTAMAYNHHNRSRHIKRGNDSLKRARSVEALLCEKSPWNFSNSQPTMVTNGATDSVTIEDKINNARDRLLSGTDSNPPKRLTSIIDDTERPPPDLVKQTLKIFEASANRRGRVVNRNNGGEVASKVASYKSIITQNKPAITFPKPPVSPKKSKPKPEIKSILSTPPPPSPSSSASSIPTSPIVTPAVQNEKNLSPLSSTPAVSSRTTTSFRPKMDSTPIRNIGCVSSVVEGLSENSPDIIPRHKLLDKTLPAVVAVDSPVTELTKKIEKLRIESPTTTQTHQQQQPQPTQKEYHSRFSSESSDRESEDDDDDDDDDDSMDGEYVVNTEDYTPTATAKPISKSALENIAKAGTSQQFLFQKKSSASFSNGNSSAAEPLHDIPSLAPVGAATTVKQIGVIRPLVAEPQPHIENNSIVVERIEEMSIVQSTPTLTSREIEKNRINNEKKIEKSGSLSPMDKLASVGVSKYNKSDITGNSENDNNAQAPAWSSAIISKKKRNPVGVVPENNTMVFNFKDRKEVPDYIENDGLIFKRKRELPKPNESGFVLLGDLSLETSTDPDDEWPICPPSPCDVEFENAHIIIDGKSNIKNRPKEAHLRVQFNDTLTSTFEYPSESSVIEDSGSEYLDYSSNELDASTSTCGASANISQDRDSPIVHHHVKSEEIIQLPHNNKVLGNLSLGSAPLGSYTPIKAKTENIFQLGVTRVPNSQSDKTGDAHSNEKQPADYYGELDNPSLEYLKPASDDLTIAYSEGSLKTDLLY